MKKKIKPNKDIERYFYRADDEFIERYSSYIESLPMEIF